MAVRVSPPSAGNRLGSPSSPKRTSDTIRLSKAFAIALALLLVVGGLLFFAHTQTQALFKDARDLELMNIHTPRNDGGILFGATLSAFGITLLCALISPLRPSDRLIPAFVLTACTLILLTAHFSIFINGLTFPDERALAVQSAFLFHDTASTIPIATFTLAVVTLLVLIAGGIALLMLVAPKVLNDHFLEPKTLTSHRTRLFVLTLFALGVGATFARQFFLFAISADTSTQGGFSTNLLAIVYYLMGAILGAILLTFTWRSSLLLWGRLEDRISRRFRLSHQRLLHLESSLWGLLLFFVVITFIADPIYEPPADTDPVFAISSQGVSWASLIIFGIYLLHRQATRSYRRFLPRLPRPLPRVGWDHLMALGTVTAAVWTIGGIVTLQADLSPLGQLVVRLLPPIFLIPLFALRLTTTDISAPRPAGESSPLLLFGWAVLSLLAGIMLWGIGNSVTIIFSQGSGGFLTPEGRLLQPYSGGIRLLGSILLAAPLILALWLLTSRRQKLGSPALLVVTGVAVVFTMNILLTIDPGARFDPELGHTDVLVGFWAFLMSTKFDVAIMITLSGASAVAGIAAALVLLRRGADQKVPPLPGSGWWDPLREWTRRRLGQVRRS